MRFSEEYDLQFLDPDEAVFPARIIAAAFTKEVQPLLQAESRPVFLRRSSSYVVSVDLGQSTDPTAIAVIEWQKGVMDHGTEWERHAGLSGHLQKPAEFADVRHLERLPLGMSYPSVVQRIADMLARPPIEGAELIIDETGVGRAVGDIFR